MVKENKMSTKQSALVATVVLVCTLITLVLWAATSEGASPSEISKVKETDYLKRKVKVALALSKTKWIKAQPAPKPVEPKDSDKEVKVYPEILTYETAYNRAIKENKPVVVFVNCQKVKLPKDTLASELTRWGGLKEPAVLIGIPGKNNSIDVVSILECSAVAANIDSHLEEAKNKAKKVKSPKKTPKPLNWQILNSVPVQTPLVVPQYQFQTQHYCPTGT